MAFSAENSMTSEYNHRWTSKDNGLRRGEVEWNRRQLGKNDQSPYIRSLGNIEEEFADQKNAGLQIWVKFWNYHAFIPCINGKLWCSGILKGLSPIT